MTHTDLDALYDCVQSRPRPEDVAALIEELGVGRRSLALRVLLARVSANSTLRLSQRFGSWSSSMPSDFQTPAAPAGTVETARALFAKAPVAGTQLPELSASDALSPDRVRAFVQACNVLMGRREGQAFPARCNRQGRAALGLPVHHRWYNKRWRLLVRLERKIASLERETVKAELTRVAKSGLAVQISKDDLLDDLHTACYVAYLSARRSRRSQFTNQSQSRAHDPLAHALFQKCLASQGTRWDVIARVDPSPRVLAHLSEEQKGVLLGQWFTEMVRAAELLEECAKAPGIDLHDCVVRPGNDSSTWNLAAGAWNTARAAWVTVLHALGMDSLLDSVCPGKAMRLMAADVAYWHRSSGGGLHPDTLVFRALPSPWEVVQGRARCTRAMVVAACEQVDDPKLRPASWTCGLTDPGVAVYRPTPELVHGVSVSSPELATVLRKAGVFSGRVSNPD